MVHAPTDPDGVTLARTIDEELALAAAQQLVLALGAKEGSEVARRTPQRMVEALTQMLTVEPWSFTTFPNTRGQHELVVVRAIPFTSLCEHHVLPFQGTAHVGYLPAERLPGLSKIARTVQTFARGLQVQEDLGQEIAAFLTERLACAGVAVVLTATHACMSCRGVRVSGTSTITLATRGLLSHDNALLDRFLTLCSLPAANLPDSTETNGDLL
ncbi:GTP cyclohydrolase I FolE [Kineosporia rhizophila]|uniref:GTP cyclohydrolase I n=1 Tax=Kineosporia rhizophila TaxID=84633 RepID=UPI001E2CE385|nr:GTP cyclohydrolase I FolE [Kineosporia rhizophila]